MQPLPFTRRKFLYTAALSTAGAATGCAVNPVTKKSQLMLVSQDEEIALDKKNSPHQLSADYGTTTDATLNAYVKQVGQEMAARTHRPDMPYNFHCVNATYVNAYAFPGGTIACTRGIMLTMQDEAELAALLGHELGHVNARHTASRMSTAQVTTVALLALLIPAAIADITLDTRITPLIAGLGSIGAGLLLATYSREDERDADSLGMEYMVQSGYSPEGMVDLQQHLVDLSKGRPNAIEMLFATHPMSTERRTTANKQAKEQYAYALNQKTARERYMDNTAQLRSIEGAVLAMQTGEKQMQQEQYHDAEASFQQALAIAPADYAGLLLMSKALLAQGRTEGAQHYVQLARQANPNEPQADHMEAMTALQHNEYEQAYSSLQRYEQQLPGNATTTYFQAQALDGMGNREAAAMKYQQYLDDDPRGPYRNTAFKRLKQMSE